MDFTIYTWGDVEVFRAALTGVAMMFSATSGLFVAEDGALGFGTFTSLALLISLAIMLVNGVIKQQVELGGFIMTVVVFFLMFVPKFSVNIEDYNGTAIAKVDGVPLGVALPAGMVGGLARDLNIKMSTAFSTISQAAAGTDMGPKSLESPLKLLLSLRNTNKFVNSREPVLASNLMNLVAYCLAGRGQNYSNWLNGKIIDDPIIKVITDAGSMSGVTMYQDSTATEPSLTTCADASTKLRVKITTMSETTAGSLQYILTAAAAQIGAAPIAVDPTSSRPTVQPVTPALHQDALKLVFDGTNSLLDSGYGALKNASDNADKFVRKGMFASFVSEAFLCANDSGNPEDWASCIPVMGAIEQAKEDDAAAGTMFQRIMFHGMNFMFFLWICLTPIVAIVMLLQGMRGMKLAGSYLMFGAWAVSWYVGASIVNFYMLKQIQYEVAMLGGVADLTDAAFWQFFNVISQKIAVAGQMMASVPLIMMTIMSGSMYGMVQLAQRMGSADRYDEKVNTPSAVGSAPITAVGSRNEWLHGDKLGQVDKAAGIGPSIDISGAQSYVKSFARESATVSQKLGQRAINQAITESFGSGYSAENGAALSKSLKSAQQHELATGVDFINALSKTDGVSSAQMAQVTEMFKTQTQAGFNLAKFVADVAPIVVGGAAIAAAPATGGTSLLLGAAAGTGTQAIVKSIEAFSKTKGGQAVLATLGATSAQIGGELSDASQTSGSVQNAKSFEDTLRESANRATKDSHSVTNDITSQDIKKFAETARKEKLLAHSDSFTRSVSMAESYAEKASEAEQTAQQLSTQTSLDPRMLAQREGVFRQKLLEADSHLRDTSNQSVEAVTYRNSLARWSHASDYDGIPADQKQMMVQMQALRESGGQEFAGVVGSITGVGVHVPSAHSMEAETNAHLQRASREAKEGADKIDLVKASPQQVISAANNLLGGMRRVTDEVEAATIVARHQAATHASTEKTASMNTGGKTTVGPKPNSPTDKVRARQVMEGGPT